MLSSALTSNFKRKEMKPLRKLRTLDDLYNFYANQNKSFTFDSKESDSVIIVQIPEKLKFSDEYDPTWNQLPVHLMSCHLYDNKNMSYISEDAMKEAIPSFYNRPILGYIQKIDDGDGKFHYDFAGHEMDITSDGEIEYKEAVVGVIPESCNPQLVYHEENDKTYLELDGLIYEDYTHAAEILRSKGQCDVSVEISVNKFSFDRETSLMDIQSFTFLGVTILGVTTDENHTPVEPGMEGSNITISDFNAENNSLVFNKAELIEEITATVLQKLDYKAEESAVKTTERRKNKLEFEEKIEETTVDVVKDEVTEDTVENEEVFEEATKETPEVVDNAETIDAIEDVETVETFDDPVNEPEETVDVNEEIANTQDDDEKKVKINSMTVTIENKVFEVSLNDIQRCLSMLVNDMYADADSTFYDTIVYADSKNVVMVDACSGKAYKQGYKEKQGTYSLVGQRIPVKPVFVTADEEAELDKMRNQYITISDRLARYESEPEKMAILNSSDYANIADLAEFVELKKQDNHFELSVDEVKEKADAMLLAYAKSGKLKFSAVKTEEKEEPKKDFFAFAKIDPKTDFLDSLLKAGR